MNRSFRLGRIASFSLGALGSALVVSAATYLPMSDADLAGQAPVIARASVVGSTVELEPVGGDLRPVTLVTLQRLEAIKGDPGDSFVVSLPGGRVGQTGWAVPGTPVFADQSEVVVMLAPLAGHPGRFRLTELGLSKFDLVTDDAGRRFAVRPAFPGGADLVASKRAPVVPGGVAGARDAESFLTFLRAVARGQTPAEVSYGAPVSAQAKWVNLGGREPGDCSPPDDPGSGPPCLWRWYWDTATQPSPNAVLTVNGTQSNLDASDEPKCGTDSICDVKNVATAWPGVASTDIRLSGPSTPGNITINLDATESHDGGNTWNTPIGCTGGVIGLGGPGEGTGPRSYRGDTSYFAITDGTVSMRKSTCNLGYSAATFRSAVLHEVGHVLGLNHPDDSGPPDHTPVESIHSTTQPADWSNAVMHAVIGSFKPDAPQTDDVQAVQFLYGTAPIGPPPTANFTWSPLHPAAGDPVTFTDTSTGGATGWNWNFGDGSAVATTKTATHAFSSAQTFDVTLTAGSLNGSGAITFPITVASAANCDATAPGNLCLDGGRFKVTINWAKTDGTSGFGTAVPLTDDSGYFWFFDNSNIETVVKVLNGCSLGGNYWVFAAGLTNVQATLTVFDTKASKAKTYSNPQGVPFAPIQDTAAFATCP